MKDLPFYFLFGNRGRNSSAWRSLLLSVALNLLLSAWSIPRVSSADCIDYGNYIHWTGQAVLGWCDGVAFSGSFAYVVNGGRFAVIDVTDPSAPTLVGETMTLHHNRRVAVSGSYAYVAALDAGLTVIDVANPASPIVVTDLDTGGQAEGVAIWGSYALLADGDAGIKMVDITNPTQPTVVDTIDTPGYAIDIDVSGELAYVADYASGLQVVDISDPAAMAIVGSVDTRTAVDVCVSGGYAYVADRFDGVKIVDVATVPTAPFMVKDLPYVGAAAYGVQVSGEYLYVAGFDHFIQVDIAQPPSAVVVSSFATPFDADGLAVTETHAYVVDSRGLEVFSLKDPLPSGSLKIADTPGLAWSVGISDHRAYVADEHALRIIDLSSPTLAQIGSLDAPSQGVAVAGNHAYVLGGTVLQVVDITDASLPTLVGSLDTMSEALAIAVSGVYAYVANGRSGLRVIDVSAPQFPVIVAAVDTDASGVAISGPYAYVTDRSGPLRVVDISDPTHPSVVGSVDTPGTPVNLDISGNFAYLTGDMHPAPDVQQYGLLVVDITNPLSPQVRGQLSTPGNTDGIRVAGHIAYVSDNDSGVHMVDVTDPDAPRVVGNVGAAGYARTIGISDDFVYVPDGPSGLIVVPVQCSVVSPVALSYFQATTQGLAVLLEWRTSFESEFSGFRVWRSVEARQGFAPLNDRLIRPSSTYRFLDEQVVPGQTYYYRLEEVDRSGESRMVGLVSAIVSRLHPQLNSVSPNPFVGREATIVFTLAQNGNARLRILDLAGRQIRVLMDEQVQRGTRSVTWDGRDDAGQLVTSGVYLYDLVAPQFRASKRLVRIR